MSFTLRDYQHDMLNAIYREVVKGTRRILVRSATGTGKTVTFAHLLKHHGIRAFLDQFPEGERRMIIIAHREELLDQAAEKMIACNPGLMVTIEQGDRYASRYSDVVIASIQTLAARDGYRLDRLMAQMQFRLVVVDECHHAAAKSYREVLHRLGFLPSPDSNMGDAGNLTDAQIVAAAEARLAEWDQIAPKDRILIGFTATPNRSDAVGLSVVFQTIAFSYGMKDAIGDGYLVPLRPYAVETDTSLDGVKTTAGEFNQKDLANAVNTPQRNVAAFGAWREYGGEGRATLCFTVDVQHAHDAAAVWQKAGYRFEAISGETPKEQRRALLRDFQRGAVDGLCNAMLLTEGTDLPRASCLVHMKPTKSATLYEQMCLDAETEILTAHGWAGINTDITGVRVAAFDLSDGSVTWSDATRIERPRGGEQMWGVSSPHLDIRVTGGHRMVVRTRHKTEWHIRSAEDLPAEASIPLCGVQRVSDADISDDEITFLGLLLTDGSLSAANRSISIFQSDRYPGIVDLIDRTLENMGVKYTRSAHQRPSNFGPRHYPLNRWTISEGPPRGRDKHLRGWGALAPWVSHDAKSLTAEYEKLSARQVGVLVRAMHAGDGLKRQPDGWISGSTSICANPVLADQVQSLCVRRGFMCNASPRSDRLVMLHISEHRPDWTIVRHASDGRPTWDVVTSAPDERVWCVTVSTGAIITRRHGKVAVVGNTGRGLRLHPESGKTDCVVIDMVDIARKHTLQAAPMLYGLPPKLAAQGKDLKDIEREVTALRDEFPNADIAELLEGLTTIDGLRAKLKALNVWEVQQLPEGVITATWLDWIRLGDILRLSYPWRDGNETLEVTQDILGHFDVVRMFRPRDAAGVDQGTIVTGVHGMQEAAVLAEQFITNQRSTVVGMKARDAGWKGKPASPKQIAFLRRLKVPFPPNVSSGEASRLIDIAKARK